MARITSLSPCCLSRLQTISRWSTQEKSSVGKSAEAGSTKRGRACSQDCLCRAPDKEVP